MNWFFKIFKTDNSTYLYDARTNIILRFNKNVDPNTLLDIVNKKYCYIFGESFLKEFEEIKEIRFQLDKNDVIDKVENEMKELLLNVSEDCNFRCDYCLYSGKYYFERTHSQKKMNKDIAQKAIDFFFAHNIRSDPVYFSFYGGEPLLAYDLVRNCVDYTKERYYHKNVIFGMTTNGSLLTFDKFDFIVKNNFNLLVSLDGPKRIHDRNRKYPNQSGTYETIMSNLKKLRTYSSDYYKEIGFLATVPDPIELKVINEFFKNNELVKGHRVTTSFVNPYDTNVSIISHPEEVMDKMWSDLANEHCKSIIQRSNFSPLLQRLFDLDLKIIYEREMNIINPYIPLKGACVPGNRKIFVTSSGDIHICERVGNAFKIGDVHRGINYDKVIELVDEYIKLNQTDCPTCWAVRLCRPCYAYFRKNNKLDLDRKREACGALKENLLRGLYIYTKVYEKNSSALQEYFKQYQILTS